MNLEQSILGCIIRDSSVLDSISGKINYDDFTKEKHKKIFKKICEMEKDGEHIDIVTLSDRLPDVEAGYMAKMLEVALFSSNINFHIKELKKKSSLRKLRDVGHKITELSEGTGILEDIFDESERLLFEVSQTSVNQEVKPIGNILNKSFERIDDLIKNKGKLRGVPTGFVDIDNKLLGLQNSDLIILAARPSVGKTSLALDIARNVGIKYKQAVGLFSLEMSGEQLSDRMIAAESNIDLWRLKTGNLCSKDIEKITETISKMSEAPIFIDDTSSLNITQLRATARRLKKEHDLKLIIIDYLQLMNGNKENRVQEISDISRGLKTLAKELNIPILALSQLSRAVESRNDQRPKLSDLRESGSIEQDADIVMFIYREDRVNPNTDKKGLAELIISKHRNGSVGDVKLYFKEEVSSFKNLEQVL